MEDADRGLRAGKVLIFHPEEQPWRSSYAIKITQMGKRSSSGV